MRWQNCLNKHLAGRSNAPGSDLVHDNTFMPLLKYWQAILQNSFQISFQKLTWAFYFIMKSSLICYKPQTKPPDFILLSLLCSLPRHVIHSQRSFTRSLVHGTRPLAFFPVTSLFPSFSFLFLSLLLSCTKLTKEKASSSFIAVQDINNDVIKDTSFFTNGPIAVCLCMHKRSGVKVPH